MSMTTLGSHESTSASSHVLYEEDTTTDEEPAAGGTRKGNDTNSTMKSENTILIETFLTHFLRHRTPYNAKDQCVVGVPKEQLFRLDKEQDINASPLSDCTLTVLDFEIDRLDPSFEDLLAILSEVLALKVRYKMISGENEEEKVGFFIAKVPAQSTEDRQLASMASVDHREILFYTKTAPDIMEWLKHSDIDLELSLAQCYYAQYNRPLEPVPVPGVIENLGKAESILVLEDLRPQGFGKRHYSQSLSLSEVKAALREICKVHATTWAMQEMNVGGEPLKKLWPFYYKPEYGAMLYEALLEDGLPRFENHLRELVEVNRDMQAARILERLILLKSRGLRPLLYKLLASAHPPAPTCLVHMDFWADNIFFRKDESSGSSDDKVTDYIFELVEPSTSSDNNAGDSTANDYLDCRILDWQMFSIGRPTHDIALLLYTSLDPPTRKDCTDGLLEFYYKTFRSIAEKFKLSVPFDLSIIYEQFHRSQLLAVLQVIASIDLVLQDETTVERLMEALLDLIQQKAL